LVAGALASVRHLRKSNDLRMCHQERAATLKQMMRESGLPVLSSVSHIVPLHVGNPIQCKELSDYLLREYDIYVQPINYPTVPKGKERLRFTPTPFHDDLTMEKLICALNTAWDLLKLKRAA